MSSTIHGQVAVVQKIRTRQVCQIIIEIPSEHFAKAVEFDERDVLISLPAMPLGAYGVIPDEELDEAAKPESMGLTEAVIRVGKASKGKYGNYARQMVQAGVFYNHKVLAELGSDAQYQLWCRSVGKCDACGANHRPDDNPIVFAHVTRADRPPSGGKGKGSNKTIYSGHPLCKSCHDIQHAKGELAVYLIADARKGGVAHEACTVDDAKQWRDGKAAKHLLDWARARARKALGVDSLSEVSPEEWAEWGKAHGIMQWLPKPNS